MIYAHRFVLARPEGTTIHTQIQGRTARTTPMRIPINAAPPRTIHAPLVVAECTKAGEQVCFIVTIRAPQNQPTVPTQLTSLCGLACIDVATLLADTHVATRRPTTTRTQGCLTVTNRAPQSQPIATTFPTTLHGPSCIDLATLRATAHTATRLAVATNQILQRTAEAAMLFPSFVLGFKQVWGLLPETRLAVQEAIRAAIA